MKILDLVNIENGTLIQKGIEVDISQFLFDSRLLKDPVNTLFYAIKSDHNDGHLYVKSLYERGVRAFIISDRSFDVSDFPEANFIITSDVVKHLQSLSAWHRSKFDIPILGITGSNGKTIIKEWIGLLLAKKEHIVKTPHSFNSQIGLPISVLNINQTHTFGVFEVGISKVGEMLRLENLLQPNIGILTNIGSAHDKGFKDNEEKIREKLLLFIHSDTLIYCIDNPTVHDILCSTFADKKLISWGYQLGATYQVTVSRERDHSIIFLYRDEKENKFSTFFREDSSIENLIHSIVFLLEMGFTRDEIQEGIQLLGNIPARLEIKQGINNNLIIDDTYSFDPVSFDAAIDTLNLQGVKLNKMLILSDLPESFINDYDAYMQIINRINQTHFESVFFIGERFEKFRTQLPKSSHFYSSIDSFFSNVNTYQWFDKAILIKGSRRFKLEKISSFLKKKVAGTVLEVDLNALIHNYKFYRSKLRTDVKIMAMVKAFAYGSGALEVSKLLQYHNVDYLAVAYLDEGIYLRQHGIDVPIMVMNPSTDSIYRFFEYNLEPEIYGFEILESFIKASKNESQKLGCHIKLDTGMHRLGFQKEQLNELCRRLKNHNISIKSIFTHLVGTDEKTHDNFTQTQFDLFQNMASTLEPYSSSSCLKHVLNSAGIVRFPEYQLDMVRLGIGLYGIDSANLFNENLRVVNSLKSYISQLRTVKKGESVGYSRKGKAVKNSVIATIPIGYADGFSRRFSNGVGKVIVKNKFVPVIGNICMDMSMLDVTGLDVGVGDEVEIFGESMPVQEQAKAIGTIAYEILTNVGERINKAYLHK